jgi:hypothetical protein
MRRETMLARFLVGVLGVAASAVPAMALDVADFYATDRLTAGGEHGAFALARTACSVCEN